MSETRTSRKQLKTHQLSPFVKLGVERSDFFECFSNNVFSGKTAEALLQLTTDLVKLKMFLDT